MPMPQHVSLKTGMMQVMMRMRMRIRIHQADLPALPLVEKGVEVEEEIQG